MSAETVEHGQLYSDGSMLVRPNDEVTERVYPVAEWINHHQRHGKVYRRRVIVVSDWEEVSR